jgi:hypothetical protein
LKAIAERAQPALSAARPSEATGGAWDSARKVEAARDEKAAARKRRAETIARR